MLGRVSSYITSLLPWGDTPHLAVQFSSSAITLQPFLNGMNFRPFVLILPADVQLDYHESASKACAGGDEDTYREELVEEVTDLRTFPTPSGSQVVGSPTRPVPHSWSRG